MSDTQLQLTLLSFDGVHLLVPQGDVATIETAGNIDTISNGDGSLGRLRAMGSEWPVYALASNFEPIRECPPSYKYCVPINRDSQAAFSLACEQVSTVSVENDSESEPLQDCMRASGSPIASLLLKDNKLMLLTDITTMQHYLHPEEVAA